jgi:hypothetical protein
VFWKKGQKGQWGGAGGIKKMAKSSIYTHGIYILGQQCL